MNILIFIIISFIINFIIYKKIDLLSQLINVFDYPDALRKIHKKPVPLLGGVFIYINLVIFILLHSFYFEDQSLINSDYQDFLGLLITTSLFFILGFLDDKIDLNSYLKFILMILILYIGLIVDTDLNLNLIKFSFSETEINLGNFGIPFTILCFLLFINAFNMLDGINGQASIYTLIVFSIILSINYLDLLIFLNICLLFFLFFNLKNKIFLGDNGTLVLGYLIGFFCIKSYNLSYFKFSDEIFLIMCMPGYELLRLFVKRACEKRDPFSADRNHLHHYVIKNYNLINTTIIMQTLFFMPILLYFLLDNFYISFIFSLLAYSLSILILKNK